MDASRTTLGVKLRDSPDMLMDEHRFVYPKTGGLSVAPIPASLPTSKRPPALGGTSRNPVWKLDIDNLPASLVLRPTSTKHGLIEPTEPTRAEEYQRAIHGLEALWVQVQAGDAGARAPRVVRAHELGVRPEIVRAVDMVEEAVAVLAVVAVPPDVVAPLDDQAASSQRAQALGQDEPG